MSLLGYSKVIPCTKFEHFGIIRFWVVFRILVWKMHLLILWPWPLTFQLRNQVTSRISQGYSLYGVWTLWDHSFFSDADQQTNKQTNRQTDRRTRTSYPRRKTQSTWIVTENPRFQRGCSHSNVGGFIRIIRIINVYIARGLSSLALPFGENKNLDDHTGSLVALCWRQVNKFNVETRGWAHDRELTLTRSPSLCFCTL